MGVPTHNRRARIVAVLCAALAVTAGWGPQYLLWPLPLLVALATPRRERYIAVATIMAALYYLPFFDSPIARQAFLAAASWPVIAALVALAWPVVASGMPLRGRTWRPRASRP